ncbi:MAG: hypothetical protein ABIS51_23395 [Sphingomonas sp.]
MTDLVALTRNIEKLRSTLDVDQDALLAAAPLGDQRALRTSVELCTLELQRLLYRLITSPLDKMGGMAR